MPTSRFPDPFNRDDLTAARDHGSVVELDVDECLELLATTTVGRVAINDDKGPLVLPVNHVVDTGTVVFRTTFGTKLVGAEQRVVGSYQVDHVDPDAQTGWSVLVRGRLHEVVRTDELEHLRSLGLQPLAGGTRQHWIRVMAASITGRRVEAPDPDHHQAE